MKRVVVLSAARAELRAAARWYESRRRGLGLELIAVVDEAMERVAAHPEAAPLWKADRPYRRQFVRRFPYALFFEVVDEIVIIVAIAHQRRRPGYWLDR